MDNTIEQFNSFLVSLSKKSGQKNHRLESRRRLGVPDDAYGSDFLYLSAHRSRGFIDDPPPPTDDEFEDLIDISKTSSFDLADQLYQLCRRIETVPPGEPEWIINIVYLAALDEDGQPLDPGGVYHSGANFGVSRDSYKSSLGKLVTLFKQKGFLHAVEEIEHLDFEGKASVLPTPDDTI